MKSVAIVGAGIAGRLLAWRLAKAGYSVTVFERSARDSKIACSFAAAGILSPYAELDMAEPTIYELGSKSLALYEQWLTELPQKVFFRNEGSLVIAHGADRVELDRFYNMVQRKLNTLSADVLHNGKLSDDKLSKVDLHEFSQNLEQFGQGLFCSEEGQIDPIELLDSLLKECENLGVSFKFSSEVQSLAPHSVMHKDHSESFDWVFDCRGLSAKDDAENAMPLRAVRGELLWLDAPDVELDYLVRLMHPRYRIYIVPRPNNVYLVGATEIESEDFSPVSVRSSLELLSAVYSVDKGFGEARIIKQVVNCRPALPDNLPCCELEKGFGRINGLYRHGILLSPALVEKMVQDVVAHDTLDLNK